MSNYYIMNRRGNFSAAFCTSNQCAFPGAEQYSYRVSARFPGNSRLDENKFLIDHNHIDQVINDLKLSGSCEQMEERICDALVQHFDKVGLDAHLVQLEIGSDEETVTAHGVEKEWNAWMRYECNRLEDRQGIIGGARHLARKLGKVLKNLPLFVPATALATVPEEPMTPEQQTERERAIMLASMNEWNHPYY